MKTCRSCSNSKPCSAFYRHPGTKDRLDQRCKQCTHERLGRLRRSPNGAGKHLRLPPIVRFWNSVRFTKTCWVWQSANSRNSRNRYGQFRLNGKTIPVHRFAYEHFIGPIPDGLLVCHHCDNPPCIRPSHLFLGNHSDNARDMVRKNRHGNLLGSRNPSAKLTEADVDHIRQVLPHQTLKAIADAYGVSAGAIWHIKHHRNWR